MSKHVLTISGNDPWSPVQKVSVHPELALEDTVILQLDTDDESVGVELTYEQVIELSSMLQQVVKESV